MKREYLRKDGLCLNCKKPRNPRKNPYSGIAPFLDPFCSSNCCKEYHGVTVTQPQKREKKVEKWDDSSAKRRARLARDGCPPGHKPSAANYRNGGRCEECREAYRIWQREKRMEKQVAA